MNTENNKLIAEFMGATIKSASQMASGVGGIDRESQEFYVDFGNHWLAESMLRYHESWDWLMPVCKKILEHGYVVTLPDNFEIEDLYKNVVSLVKYINELKQDPDQ